jgi:hypothetical protein
MAVIFVFALKMFAATLPLPLDEVGKMLTTPFAFTIYGALSKSTNLPYIFD